MHFSISLTWTMLVEDPPLKFKTYFMDTAAGVEPCDNPYVSTDSIPVPFVQCLNLWDHWAHSDSG